MSVAPPMNASVLDAVVEAGNLTQWDTLNVPYFISEVLVAVVAVIGNALTITVFVVERKLRRRTNYYIVSLALADLLVGVFGIPFAILTSVGLPRPLWACLFMLSTLLVLCTVSIFCLLAVSVDRYWAILHPLRYSRVMTARIARRIILMCWVAGTLVGLLPVMGWYNTKNEYNQVCYFVKVMSYNYLVFIYFGTIVFPGVLMAAFYTHIYTVVLKQLRQIAAQEPQGDTASVGTQGSQRQRSYIFRSQSRGQVSESSRYDSHRASTNTNLNQMAHPNRREVKAAKSLSIIVLFFMISWFPLYTINCVQAFCKHCTASSGVMFFTITLTHLNSAINPFLYAYHMHDFRAALKSFILHHILRRPLDPDLMINRSVASLHHHSTMHRINVNDACLTNVHTPRSHNSPVSGSPMDGIRSRSSTLGSFGPWDSYKALSTSVSFPSSPAFTTPSSVGAHTNDFLSHRPQVTTLISHGKSILTKDIHDTTDETSQALLPSSVALCVPTTHHSHRLNSHDTLQNNNLNNNLSQTDQQFSLTNSVTSLPPPQTEMDDTADVAVNDDHHRWSLGTDQYEESPARSESEATVQVGDALESKDINNIHNFSEPETMNSTVQPLSDSSLTGSVCTDTNKEQNSKQEGSSSCIAYSTTFPLAPTASIETLHDSPCNGISQPSQDCTEAVSVSDEALSQVACGRLSSQDVEITDASGINQSDAQTPTSLLSNGSACGPMHSSPEEGLSSPTSPVELGPESLIPQVTESEPSIFLRQLGKYLPKILQKKEGGQRPRFFRLQNWWSQDSRHKSYHGISMESRDSTLTRRACSVSGAIGT
ncbi:uncharacterized protein LOC123516859 isoform X4 [Portunus trituberculatus]|uniref:uncharacterized protein LOC123516859 isoform X4 n=1 Tax=Portunus trituberculatus TaxID=210409 RepID=UPI001E1CF61B|nr:uncharacterized protein LOC123516859 isoform X4 [Portunus trituberculatus]